MGVYVFGRMLSFDHIKLNMVQSKREDWSSINFVVESQAIRIDREMLKNEVVEEVIVSEP